MIYKLTFIRKKYKGRPLATFLSFLYGYSGIFLVIITLAALFAIAMLITSGDLIPIIFGSIIIITLYVVFFVLNKAIQKYLDNLDNMIITRNRELEIELKKQEFLEFIKAHPNISSNEETQIFRMMSASGYSALTAYETIQRLNNK